MFLPRVFAFLCILLVLSPLANGDETYSVSGEVIFPEAEVIFISLYTFERFQDHRNKPLPPPPFSQMIEVSPEQREAGRASFAFTQIPKGTYGILAFRDKNAPRIADRDVFKEPLSYYMVTRFSGNWDDIKIRVDRDITGIKIKF